MSQGIEMIKAPMQGLGSGSGFGGFLARGFGPKP